MVQPVKKKTPWRKKLLIGAAVAGIGLGVAGTAHTVREYNAIKARQAVAVSVSLAETRAVRDPNAFGRICATVDWSPRDAKGIAKIRLIESVSRKTGLGPERVVITIASNKMQDFTLSALDAKIAKVQSDLKNYGQKVASLNKPQDASPRKRFEQRVVQAREELARVKRVKAVVQAALAENPDLAQEISADSIGKLKLLRKIADEK